MESLINDWLADCAELSSSEYTTFANTLSQDDDIVSALYLLFEDRSKYPQLLESICNQLFNFYRSREIQLQRFTLQFIPTLIHIYLNSAAHGDIKNCRTVETLLVSLYNLELVDKDGESKAVSFRLPSLAMTSLYHEPSSLAHASLTESAVRRFEECNSKLVSWGPLKHIETLNAQNRLQVMTALLFLFNQNLGFIKKSALEQLCKIATKLVTQGFMKPGFHQRSSYNSESSFVPRLLPRIPVSSQFLLEFLQAIYYSMYNDCWYVAVQAVEEIHFRACYETFTDVMLVTNAIRNSSSSGPTAQNTEGSIGISVSSASSTSTMIKSMITNASFRTKKLPDDLDEMLFDNNEESKAADVNTNEKLQPQMTPVSNNRRRAWLWKNPLHNSFDENEIAEAKAGISTPAETSRRESVCSSQSSPVKGSPKKNRESKGKKNTEKESSQEQGDTNNKPKSRRDSLIDNLKEKIESSQNATQRLYRVLEERALGETVDGSKDNLKNTKNKNASTDKNRLSY